jgi:hypothetical protein
MGELDVEMELAGTQEETPSTTARVIQNRAIQSPWTVLAQRIEVEVEETVCDLPPDAVAAVDKFVDEVEKELPRMDGTVLPSSKRHWGSATTWHKSDVIAFPNAFAGIIPAQAFVVLRFASLAVRVVRHEWHGGSASATASARVQYHACPPSIFAWPRRQQINRH